MEIVEEERPVYEDVRDDQRWDQLSRSAPLKTARQRGQVHLPPLGALPALARGPGGGVDGRGRAEGEVLQVRGGGFACLVGSGEALCQVSGLLARHDERA